MDNLSSHTIKFTKDYFEKLVLMFYLMPHITEK